MTEVSEDMVDKSAKDPLPSRLRLPTWLRGNSPTLTYLGIATAMIGFVLIAIAWGLVADETQVSLQIPYVVSAGLTGIGLVMVGLTVVNVAAKRRDEQERDRQIERLVSILEELRTAFTDQAGRPRDRRR